MILTSPYIDQTIANIRQIASWKTYGNDWEKFGLELHPAKTRRIEFGRFAEQNRKRRGEGKPETFDFLAGC